MMADASAVCPDKQHSQNDELLKETIVCAGVLRSG